LAAKYEGTLGPSPVISVRWGDSTTINEALEAWSDNGWQDLSPTTVRHYREWVRSLDAPQVKPPDQETFSCLGFQSSVAGFVGGRRRRRGIGISRHGDFSIGF